MIKNFGEMFLLTATGLVFLSSWAEDTTARRKIASLKIMMVLLEEHFRDYDTEEYVHYLRSTAQLCHTLSYTM